MEQSQQIILRMSGVYYFNNIALYWKIEGREAIRKRLQGKETYPASAPSSMDAAVVGPDPQPPNGVTTTGGRPPRPHLTHLKQIPPSMTTNSPINRTENCMKKKIDCVSRIVDTMNI